MSLDPILSASPAIQFHIAVALLAMIVLAASLLRRRKGDRIHRTLGALWVAIMGAVAISGFFISSFGIVGPFNPIHLLSVWALVSLWRGLSHLRRGDYAAHGAEMRALGVQSLAIAAFFTLTPGRVVNESLFGEDSEFGLVVMLGLAGVLIAHLLVRRRKARLSARARRFALHNPLRPR